MSYENPAVTISPLITELSSVVAGYPITADDVASWLRLSDAQKTRNQATIDRLIKMVVETFENYMWVDLRRKTYIAEYELSDGLFSAFLDSNVKLQLNRSPVLSVDDIGIIEYLDANGAYQTLDKGTEAATGLFENVTERKEQRGWASVYLREAVPFDADRANVFRMRVTYTAGYTTYDGVTPLVTDIPQPLIHAMLVAIAYYYTNRGDCGGCECDMNGTPIPCEAVAIANQYAVKNGILGSEFNFGLC